MSERIPSMTSLARLPFFDDPTERLPGLVQIRSLGLKPAQRCLRVGDRRRDRLVDLMGDRGRQLAEGSDAVRVFQLQLDFPISQLALAHFRLRPFALGQIDNEGHAFLSPSAESCCADQNRRPAAVLPEVFLLVRSDGPGRLQRFHDPLVLLAPLRRREVRPAHGSGG
jgi:hypothetical protein